MYLHCESILTAFFPNVAYTFTSGSSLRDLWPAILRFFIGESCIFKLFVRLSVWSAWDEFKDKLGPLITLNKVPEVFRQQNLLPINYTYNLLISAFSFV